MQKIEFVHQYYSTFDFTSASEALLVPIWPLLDALPSSLAGSSRPSALLRVLHAFVTYDECVGIVADRDSLVSALIR
jgi:hypothetical protein